MVKSSLGRRLSKAPRHSPLHMDLSSDATLKSQSKQRQIKSKQRQSKRQGANESGDEEQVVEEKMTQRILSVARMQQQEVEAEEEPSFDPEADRAWMQQRNVNDDSDDEDDEKVEYRSDEEFDQDDAEANQAADWHALNLSEQDLAALSLLDANTSIASKVMAGDAFKSPETAPTPSSAVPPKVLAVYTKVGLLLSRYKSGKLPKAFKIIPSLANWEMILGMTQPVNWTPHAMYQATRLFVSNLNAKMSQRFFNLFLLERVRADIAQNGKLSVHLYMALKKAFYKPAAFFKGILLPLVDSGTCTLREAAIIGSALAKVSVPMLHSAAALCRLAEMPYSGPQALFMRVLMDKKYALPYRVVDALVEHFISSGNRATTTLTVLWHQALLVFVQRYKQDMTIEQKQALLQVIKQQSHVSISPEVRRELQESVARGEVQMQL